MRPSGVLASPALVSNVTWSDIPRADVRAQVQSCTCCLPATWGPAAPSVDAMHLPSCSGLNPPGLKGPHTPPCSQPGSSPCDLRSPPPRVPRPHALNWQPQAPRAAAGRERRPGTCVSSPVASSPGAQSCLDSGPAPCRPVCCLLRGDPLTPGPLRSPFGVRSAEFAGGIGLTGWSVEERERWAVYPALWALPASRPCCGRRSWAPAPDGPLRSRLSEDSMQRRLLRGRSPPPSH